MNVGAGCRNGCTDGDLQRSGVRAHRGHDVAQALSLHSNTKKTQRHSENGVAQRCDLFWLFFRSLIHRCSRSEIPATPTHAVSCPPKAQERFMPGVATSPLGSTVNAARFWPCTPSQNMQLRKMKHDPNMHLHDYNARD